MKIRELLINENDASAHLQRSYDMEIDRAMTPDGQVSKINPRDKGQIAALPIGSIVLSHTVHDSGDSVKVSYEIYRKAAEAADMFAPAFEFISHLNVSPYAKGAEADAAFYKQAQSLI